MNVGKTRPVTPIQQQKKLFDRGFAWADWLASWFYFGFNNVASVRIAVEGVAVFALVITIIGIFGEIEQRKVDRGVRVATLYAQIAQLRAIPDGKRSKALAASVETLARDGVPMSNLVLSEAEIRVANLRNAYLISADLRNADFCMTDFSSADLRRANLSAANFRGTILENANFNGADLRKTDLRKAIVARPNTRHPYPPRMLCEAGNRSLDLLARNDIYFRSTKANKASFRNANLHGAWLIEAKLRDADFQDAVLTEAHLTATNLRGANLRCANLTDADFCGTDIVPRLRSAIFPSSDLRNANLWHAVLQRTQFCDVDLSNAILIGADLRNAQLVGANLKGANLTKADLSEADLRLTNVNATIFRGANLSGTDLNGAVGLCEAQVAMACAETGNPPILPKSVKWNGVVCPKLTNGVGNRRASDYLFLEPQRSLSCLVSPISFADDN